MLIQDLGITLPRIVCKIKFKGDHTRPNYLLSILQIAESERVFFCTADQFQVENMYGIMVIMGSEVCQRTSIKDLNLIRNAFFISRQFTSLVANYFLAPDNHLYAR